MNTLTKAVAACSAVPDASPLLDRIRRGVIGEGETLDGPYGLRRITYADYTASGRSLDFIEEFIRDHVLPRYANTHTESSGTGLQTTRLREESRRLIRDAVGGTDEDAHGHIDLDQLAERLTHYAGHPLLIGSFSAASNVTGVLSDANRIAALLHEHGALSFWDYAAAGPYVPIRMRESAPGRGDPNDAVFLSPHKFVGGPQTPGILVVRRELVRNAVPTTVGGGTVAFVDPLGHRYLDDPVAREEGGTPAIVESIRAGLVFALKDAVGTESIQQREEQLWQHAFGRWQSNPNIEVLGHPQASRLSIVSFRIRLAGRYLHHNYVVALLNDLFGIQARGGCSCAGPYGHRLLAIGPERSHAYRHEIGVGCEGVKPGWARINFHYLVSDAVRDYLTDAVDLLARYGHRLLSDYRFDPHTGLWHHHTGIGDPPLHLTDVRYTAAGIISPDTRPILGESALTDHLREAHALLAARSDSIPDGATGLSAGFEALRWFHLPPQCLDPPLPEQQ